MGLSHHWTWPTGQIPAPLWTKIRRDAVKLLLADDDKSAGVKASTIRVDASVIAFRTHAHPDLLPLEFERKPLPCRRGREPWGHAKPDSDALDRMVCALLAVIRERAPEHFIVESDFPEDSWRQHIDWASRVLKRPLPLPFEKKAA